MPSEHRLHPASILFALAGALKAFVLPAIVLLLTSGGPSSDRPSGAPWGPARWMNRWMPGDVEIANWQFWILLFLVPAAIVAVTRYFSFRLRYEGTELVIRSGLFLRNERHIPYLRIQNLDAVRNVAHRLLGVTEVRIETGGGQTPEATISVLHESVFEEMRRRIFEGRARAHGADVGAVDTAAEESATRSPESRLLLHLPTRELLLNGLLDNRGLILVGTVYGVLWEAGVMNTLWNRLTTIDWSGPGILSDTWQTIAAGRLPSAGRIALLLAGIAVLLAIVRGLSMIWSVMRLHDFRLIRAGDDLRTEYGLLTRVTATIPLRRVQMVTVRQTPLQRLVRRMSVRVDTAGGHAAAPEGRQTPRERLAPIIRERAVADLVSEVLPGVDLDALDWQPLHPRAFPRAVKPALVVAGVALVPLVLAFGWSALLLLPLALPWTTFGTWKHVQHMHWALTDDTIAFRSGWLWRTVTVAPVAKIQAVACASSPFDRRAEMAQLRVDTAGGRAHQLSIPYLGLDVATQLYERLTVQAAQTAFRW